MIENVSRGHVFPDDEVAADVRIDLISVVSKLRFGPGGKIIGIDIPVSVSVVLPDDEPPAYDRIDLLAWIVQVDDLAVQVIKRNVPVAFGVVLPDHLTK